MPETIEDASPDAWGDDARLARDTLAMVPTARVCTASVNLMDIPLLERVAGHPPGQYRRTPGPVYLDFQRAVGACFIDQYIPDNPGTMGQQGYGDTVRPTATTGAADIVLDNIPISGPEAVAEHLETVVLPNLEAQLEKPPELTPHVNRALAQHRTCQDAFGPNLLKCPYGAFYSFPRLRYTQYGYVPYFSAFALYPELMERDFRLQGRAARRFNAAMAAAIIAHDLPRVLRLDHDMADSRGPLVGLPRLEMLWFPAFAEAIAPLTDAGIRLIWHCDGNLWPMVPPLIEAGVGGFQGFQYEDGMHYEQLCEMTTRNGGPLMIWAGVSVTRTLPLGSPASVREEMAWLVRHAPPVGFVLGASSSVTPGIPPENLMAFIHGLHHYRLHGRG